MFYLFELLGSFTGLVIGIFFSEMLKTPIVGFQNRYIWPNVHDALKASADPIWWQEVDEFLEQKTGETVDKAMSIALANRDIFLPPSEFNRFSSVRKPQFSFDKHRKYAYENHETTAREAIKDDSAS